MSTEHKDRSLEPGRLISKHRYGDYVYEFIAVGNKPSSDSTAADSPLVAHTLQHDSTSPVSGIFPIPVGVMQNGGEALKTEKKSQVSSFVVPPHLMGRNIENPDSDKGPGGKDLQKPRFGVRVPCRTLTSQIVSSQDLAEEILQRTMKKYPTPNTPEHGDIFFAMKLTKRFADRLTPKEGESNSPPSPSRAGMPEREPPSSPTTPALLMGQGSVVDPIEPRRPDSAEPAVPLSPASSDAVIPPKLTREEEMEIALKQLSTLPVRSYRRRKLKVEASSFPQQKAVKSLQPKRIKASRPKAPRKLKTGKDVDESDTSNSNDKEGKKSVKNRKKVSQNKTVQMNDDKTVGDNFLEKASVSETDRNNSDILKGKKRNVKSKKMDQNKISAQRKTLGDNFLGKGLLEGTRGGTKQKAHKRKIKESMVSIDRKDREQSVISLPETVNVATDRLNYNNKNKSHEHVNQLKQSTSAINETPSKKVPQKSVILFTAKKRGRKRKLENENTTKTKEDANSGSLSGNALGLTQQKVRKTVKTVRTKSSVLAKQKCLLRSRRKPTGSCSSKSLQSALTSAVQSLETVLSGSAQPRLMGAVCGKEKEEEHMKKKPIKKKMGSKNSAENKEVIAKDKKLSSSKGTESESSDVTVDLNINSAERKTKLHGDSDNEISFKISVTPADSSKSTKREKYNEHSAVTDPLTVSTGSKEVEDIPTIDEAFPTPEPSDSGIPESVPAKPNHPTIIESPSSTAEPLSATGEISANSIVTETPQQTAKKKVRKKKGRELDKLFIDEGILNMLFAAQQSDSKARRRSSLGSAEQPSKRNRDVEERKVIGSRKKLTNPAVKKVIAKSRIVAAKKEKEMKFDMLKKKSSVLFGKNSGVVEEKKSQMEMDNTNSGGNQTPLFTVHRLCVPANASRIIRRRSSSSSFSSRSVSPIRPPPGERHKEREVMEQSSFKEVTEQNDRKTPNEEKGHSKADTKSRSGGKLVKSQLWRELKLLVEDAEKFKETPSGLGRSKGNLKEKPRKIIKTESAVKAGRTQGTRSATERKIIAERNKKQNDKQKAVAHMSSGTPVVQKKIQAAIRMQLKLEKSKNVKISDSENKMTRKQDGSESKAQKGKSQTEVTDKKGKKQDTKLKVKTTQEKTILGLSRQETKKLMASPSRYSLHPDYEVKGKSIISVDSDDSKSTLPNRSQSSRSPSPVRATMRMDTLELCPPVVRSPNADSYGSLVKTLETEGLKVKKKLQLDDNNRQSQRSSVRQIEGSFHYREISLRKYENFVQIIFTPGSTKMKNSFNVQVLKELQEALLMLRKDETCKVVLLTSAGSTFCQGIDLNGLLHNNIEKRKKIAEGLTKVLKEFLQTLGHFSKPLVAGVNGTAIGLGVTILPFFDMVFASDKATFYMPYSKLGQVPEGAATLTFPHLLQSSMMNDLLYGCKKLTAGEAFQCGLVTSILWPAKFQEELIPRVRNIANQSSQAMEATKALLRHHLRTKLEVTLDSECRLLVQHWSSTECQRNIKKFLETEDVALQRQRFETQ